MDVNPNPKQDSSELSCEMGFINERTVPPAEIPGASVPSESASPLAANESKPSSRRKHSSKSRQSEEVVLKSALKSGSSTTKANKCVKFGNPLQTIIPEASVIQRARPYKPGTKERVFFSLEELRGKTVRKEPTLLKDIEKEHVVWNFQHEMPEPEIVWPKYMEPTNCDGLFTPYFDLLPMELLIKIFKRLNSRDRLCAGTACKRWMEAAHYYKPFQQDVYYNFDRVQYGDDVGPFKHFSQGRGFYRKLVFSQVEFNDRCSFWTTHGINITELTLRSCVIKKDVFLAIMRTMLALQRLELMQCDELFKNWTLESNNQEPMFPFYMLCLKHLSLSGCDYFNEYHFERFIIMAPNIISIDVSNCFINLYLSRRISMLDRVMKLISRNRYIMQAINLTDTPCVDEITWHTLCEIDDLEITHLTISYTDRVPLKNPGIKRLFSTQTKLTYLDLTSSTGINDACLVILVENCPLIHTLKLRRCWLISDEGVENIHTLKHLRILDISGCERISDYGINHGIVANKRREMHEVYLALLNNLSDTTLYYMVANFTNLQVLDLDSSSNCITDCVIQYIACYLDNLKHLNLIVCTKLSSTSRPKMVLCNRKVCPVSKQKPKAAAAKLPNIEPPEPAKPPESIRPPEPDFGHLPIELLVDIFKYLEISDRNAAAYVCWTWYEASKYLAFARQMCLHLVGIEFDDYKPPVSDLLMCPYAYPVLKLTRVRLQASSFSRFWYNFGPWINEISFEKCMIWRERIINVFRFMNNLRTARFEECDLLRDDLFKEWKQTDDGLKVTQFENIRSLSLARNNFTALQFNAIVEMIPNLTELDLSDCFNHLDSVIKMRLLNCIVAFINERRYSLKHLNLSGFSVDDLFLRGIVDAEGLQLESLNFMYLELMPQRDPAIIDLLGQQVNLKKLDVSYSTGINDKCVAQIVKSMPKLEVLIMTGCWNIRDKGVTQIFQLQNLKKLDLSKCRFTKKAIIEGAVTSNRKNLQEIHLEEIDTLDEDCIVRMGANFSNLTVLNIGGSSSCISNWSAQYIFFHLTSLVEVNFERSTKLTDAGFTGIDLPQKTLSIWDIEETFSIERLKKLRLLRLSGCYKITDFTLRYALRFKELKELGLSRCHQISKQGIEKLVTSCPALETLDLSECPNINDSCVELVAQNLKRLTTLKLANCTEISETGLDHIAQYCKNLKYLYVRGCHKLPPDITERLSCIPTLRQVYKS
ncbi:uncharacterized protein LOC129743276 [Uranotaenia lowii]|uniref:uncharacterized protein LOC129743276 n=1 Tax=Uranotaenia lowii TaxID=190385 RepID=UPI0024790510|nr:uncharacterized protein LOC129743276 [Uranotaenia lowii]